MAAMIDQRPNIYQGEMAVWDAFSVNLPQDVIVYNHREINGREFDFCLLIKNIGLVIIEVKGWNRSHISKVISPEEIMLTGHDRPERSPKKQARSYRFSLLDTIGKKYSFSPLIFDLVCYPFLSEAEYKSCRLDIVSEREFTIFKEDLSNQVALGRKLNEAYNKMRNIPHSEMNDENFNKIRQHFESTVEKEKISLDVDKNVYSILKTYNDSITDNQIDDLVNKYFEGTKIFLFVSEKDDLKRVERVLNKRLCSEYICIDKGNLVLNWDVNYSNQTSQSEKFRIFNFEAYYIHERIERDLEILEGNFSEFERSQLQKISNNTAFNIDQYFIEHAPCNKNTLVEAGAGTGKTYSMVSRVAYLCNKQIDPLISLVDTIAMVTFTNDAADNMKSRLKQLFINYYILTKKTKFLKFIESIEHMQIATIHKFATSVIQSAAMYFGLGNEFSISSGNHMKKEIYEKHLDEYINSKSVENPNFFKEIRLPIYKLRKMLVLFADQLYSKSIDIKEIDPSVFGESIPEMPFFNEMIEQVIIKAEKEYFEKLTGQNKVDLGEYMIIMRKAVLGPLKDNCNLKYRFIFIDEFQDTDEAQIESFLELQRIVGFKMFVVGDLKQSIYRFRGATIRAFDKLGISNSDWSRFRLNTNYRTDSRLLSIYDRIFSRMGQNEYLPFIPDGDTLTSQIDGGIPEGELLRCVEYHSSCEDELYDQLFAEIDHQIELLKQIGKYNKLTKQEKTIAILVRENWQIKNIVQAAKKKGVNIETNVGGDLYQLPPSIDFYKLLLALNNPREPIYLYNLIASNNIDVKFDVQILYKYDKETKKKILTEVLDQYYLDKMGKTWNDLILDVHNKPILMVLKKIHDACKPWKKYSSSFEKQKFYRVNYELVLEKIIKRSSTDHLSLNELCKNQKINITTRQEEVARNIESEESSHTVLCITVHKSKGLEYGTVILPYTNQCINSDKKTELEVVCFGNKLGYAIRMGKKKSPSGYYNRSEAVAQTIKEESRVLYVAMTRAIKNLVWFKDLDQKGSDGKKEISWKTLLEE